MDSSLVMNSFSSLTARGKIKQRLMNEDLTRISPNGVENHLQTKSRSCSVDVIKQSADHSLYLLEDLTFRIVVVGLT